MCDFSVVAENRRDYQAGERLVVTQLGSHTRGTTSPRDRQTAVCLRNNVCLMVHDLPESIRGQYELPEKGEIRAIFMQLPNRESAHRDALTFENGRTILVNDLPLDLEMSVQEARMGAEVAVAKPVAARVQQA